MTGATETARERVPGLVSVVVPNYNKRDFLNECLDGIAGQTYSDWELIFVDDASTDGSLEQFDEWLARERQDGRNPAAIRLALPRNVGYAGAITAGLYMARGEYIAAQDSDDISYPQRLAKQVACLSANARIELLGTNYEVIGEDGRRLGQAGWLRYGEQIRKVYQSGGHCVCHGTIMLRGALFDRIGGHTRRIAGAEDYDFIARCLSARMDNVENLPEPLYGYRKHPQQRSRAYYGAGRGDSRAT